MTRRTLLCISTGPALALLGAACTEPHRGAAAPGAPTASEPYARGALPDGRAPRNQSSTRSAAGRERDHAGPTPELQPLLSRGAAAFRRGRCATCHGPSATGGLYAPDLTDGEWLHCDGSVEGILRVLRRGVPPDEVKKADMPLGMRPATQRITNQDDLVALAHYVHSLRHARRPDDGTDTRGR